MRIRLIGSTVAALLVAGTVGYGQGGMTGAGSLPEGMGSTGARALTPFEEIAGKFKLDEKTQVPAAIEIFNAAATEAGPVGVQILQIRQRILNGHLTGTPADVKAATDEYVAAQAKMSAIEANTFAKVYALLKPNQQKEADKAFVLMAGFFQRGAAPSGRGGRG
jgi:hypothetical protein